MASLAAPNSGRRSVWNPQRLTNLINAQALVLVQALGSHHPRIVWADRLAAAETPSRPGSRKARLGALLDQPSLELGQA